MSMQIAQFVAYVMLTLASVTVAVVSLAFAYRQNFGWSPIALSTGHGLANRAPDTEHYDAVINFEIWNRRKYPVVVRSVVVKFSVVDIQCHVRGWKYPEQWHVQGRDVMHRGEIVLEPSGHHKFEARAPFKRRPLDDLADPVVVELAIYDPRRNRIETLRLNVEYQFQK
jgi:hypothetical protein